MPGRHPVRPGRVRDQDLLQVIDDQQQRPLPASPAWAHGPASRSTSTASIASGRCRTSGSRDSISCRAAGLARTAAATASRMASAP